jgi:NAD-dependent SIR2 family protein deacetylase
MSAAVTASEVEMAGLVRQAAQWIREADVLYILAGAGMGVAAGLGTFRGANAGIWPPLEERKIAFPEMSCPRCFEEDHYLGGPNFAWSFWKWRTDAYSQAPLHEGYQILSRWATAKEQQRAGSSFVFTSNIDGHFLRVPVFQDHVVECHGTVMFSQCQRRGCQSDPQRQCSHHDRMWPTDLATHHVTSPLPLCQGDCGRPARPAVLMFGDWSVLEDLIDAQMRQERQWEETLRGTGVRGAVIEIGAGTAIPTVRHEAERFARRFQFPLIRINPEAPSLSSKTTGVGLPLGACEALTQIDAQLALL